MTTDEVMVHLKQALGDMLAVRGQAPVVLSEDTPLLGGKLPIDSLDLAELVITLTQVTGKDPFADGFIDFRTVGQLVQLYAD
jgi:acyl carrier protein